MVDSPAKRVAEVARLFRVHRPSISRPISQARSAYAIRARQVDRIARTGAPANPNQPENSFQQAMLSTSDRRKVKGKKLHSHRALHMSSTSDPNLVRSEVEDSSRIQEQMSMPGAVLEFGSVHDSFRPKIFRYLTELVGENEAEDLTQTVMLKVSKGLHNFRSGSTLSTWIYRIATNTALDKLRRRPARKWTGQQFNSTETQGEGEVDSTEVSIPLERQTPAFEANVIRKEMQECIREFIDRLPDNYKTVTVLSESEGFNNKEIAEILGVSLDTVKIRLHRARDRLRKDLETGCNFYRDGRNEFACDRKP
jgi:RNA polymerase sigma-70 factor (ECF subfamily)